MSELLHTRPHEIVFAIAIAIGIDLFRRLYLLVAGRLRHFWFGPGARPGEAKAGWVAELCTYLLFPAIAFLAFLVPMAAMAVVAGLMGFGPAVKVGALTHGMLLLWTLVVAFLWVQVWHIMSLPGFWKRVRYLLLLIAVPLLLQVSIWFALDGLFRLEFGDAEHMRLMSRLSRLLCIGVFPFFMPAVHTRLLMPLFNGILEATARRWRRTVTVSGYVVLALAVIGAVWSVGEANRRTMFAHTELPVASGTTPVAIGAPHSCMSAYPDYSRRIGETGTTTLGFRITTLGTVRDVTVLQSSGSPRLDLAAVSCVTHWTYFPASVNGQKVEAPWKAQVVWKMH